MQSNHTECTLLIEKEVSTKFVNSLQICHVLFLTTHKIQQVFYISNITYEKINISNLYQHNKYIMYLGNMTKLKGGEKGAKKQ